MSSFSKKTLLLIVFNLSIVIGYGQITYTSAFPNIGFDFTTEIQTAGDGSNRFFVVGQGGKIKVFPIKADVTENEVETFLDIEDRIGFNRVGQEIGLLGLAFHPNYKENGYFYIYHTVDSPVNGISVRIVLSRFTVSEDDPNKADLNSEVKILEIDKNQNNSNHNGGKIGFGPDGYLYLSYGDGGGGGDPKRNAQNINNLFGTICRIDVDLDGNNNLSANENYEIPTDNPFVGRNGEDEIFAYGIRNTWKFSFDLSTGRMWGADVGQNAFEEVNIIKNGKNYGWNRFEGTSLFSNNTVISGAVEDPILSISQSQGDRSITGGYVYKGRDISSFSPSIQDKYIFADYVSGRVWALEYNEATGEADKTLLFKTANEFVSTFAVDLEEELYFSDYGSGKEIYKLVDGTTQNNANAIEGIGNWSQLGTGTDGVVNAIAVGPTGDVFIGGDFGEVNGVKANNIAKWDEKEGVWSAFGSGIVGAVNALLVTPDGQLIVGGAFTSVDGVAATSIAAWNNNTWTALSTEIDGYISILENGDNGDVFVGGSFTEIGTLEVQNIAKWNNSNWSALVDQATNIAGLNNEVRGLKWSNGTLYVGGNFASAGGKTANRIALWANNQSDWSTLGNGTSGFVNAIEVTDEEVFVGGNFAIAGNQTVNRVARWNKVNRSWSSLENGLNNNVNAMLYDGQNLYCAGNFNLALESNGELSIVNSIVRWNESTGWQALGTSTSVGTDNKVNDLVFSLDSNAVYAGGNFTSAGQIATNDVAVWNGLVSGIKRDEKVKDKVIAYPNPVANILSLEKSSDWTLMDQLGTVLESDRGNKIDFTSYETGIYFIKTTEGYLKIIKR